MQLLDYKQIKNFSHKTSALLGMKKIKNISFTSKTLSHILEKGELGKEVLNSIPETVISPSAIYRGNRPERFLLEREMIPRRSHVHIVVLERNDDNLTIVTAFLANKKYLKNFEILWRTEIQKG